MFTQHDIIASFDEDSIKDSFQDRSGGSKQAKLNKQEQLQRLNIMKADVKTNNSIAQLQLHLVQLKQQELRYVHHACPRPCGDQSLHPLSFPPKLLVPRL